MRAPTPKSRRSIGASALTAITIASLTACAPEPVTEPVAPFALTPSAETVGAGQTFTVDLDLKSELERIDGISATINFPADQFDYLGTDIDTAMWDMNITGKLTEPGVLLLESATTTGAPNMGDVATIRFRTKAAGTTETIAVDTDSIAAMSTDDIPPEDITETGLAKAATANVSAYRMAHGGLLGYQVAAAADGWANGAAAGQCRVFVNNVLAKLGLNVGGGAPNNYFLGFENVGATRVTDQNALRTGDIVQLGRSEPNVHTLIVLNKVHGKANTYRVVDSNSGRTGFERVARYDRVITLDDNNRAYRVGGLPPGDVDRDGSIDSYDLSVMSRFWKQSVPIWTNGDLNGDRFVDVGDLSILANNWHRYKESALRA